jgi:hypothetical protein
MASSKLKLRAPGIFHWDLRSRKCVSKRAFEWFEVVPSKFMLNQKQEFAIHHAYTPVISSANYPISWKSHTMLKEYEKLR